MKFKEIVNRVEWENVRQSLITLYYKDIEIPSLEEYFNVFNQINNMEEKDSEGMRLYVEKIKDDEGNEYIEVIGRNGKLQKESSDFEYFKDNIDEEFANSEITYALEMTPWKKWLGMDVPITVIQNFNFPDIVAHCLYEMTFMGYNQDEIQDKLEELERRCEEVKNGTAKTISLEEFKEKFKDILEGDTEENEEDI